MHAFLAFLTVVVVPVSAVGLLALLLAPRLRDRFGRPVLAAIALAAALTLTAGFTGLVSGTGATAHAGYGTTLMVLVLALLVTGSGWYHLQRRAAQAPPPEDRGLPPAFEMLAGIATLGIVFATLITVVAAWASGPRG